MMDFLTQLDWNSILGAAKDTLYMSFVALIFASVFGLLMGIILYATQKGSLLPNRIIHNVLDLTVNIFRAVPFIILLFVIVPFTKLLVGTMLGAKAALPSLILSATPFYARMCVIAFNEVDKGTIEACEAMGAGKWDIVVKVLIPEAAPALISGIAVMGINLVGYTAMAGAIGAGGLGNMAYLYGFARRDEGVLWICTALVVVIVFVIQGIGDWISSKTDKR